MFREIIFFLPFCDMGSSPKRDLSVIEPTYNNECLWSGQTLHMTPDRHTNYVQVDCDGNPVLAEGLRWKITFSKTQRHIQQ